MSNEGKTVRVNYRGTLDDGTQFDSSYDRGEPLEFVVGSGMMIKGFDEAVKDMKVGEKKHVHLTPDEAYGYPSDALLVEFPIEDVPNPEEIKKGDVLFLQGPAGQPLPVHVDAVLDDKIVLDANHELAGKDLNFDIELVSVSD